jgi:hypothetical protein
MPALTSEQILTVWEHGLGRSPAGRVLALLAAIEPRRSWDDLARMPLGWRDRCLAAARAATFGRDVRGRLSCPGCGERVEITLPLEGGDPVPPGSDPATGTVVVGDTVLTLRALHSADLEAASCAPTVDGARRLLARRAIETATRDGAALAPEAIDAALAPEWTAAIAAWLSECDPAADTTVEVACACGAHWESPFDIAAVLWSDVETEAMRLMHAVHTLARSYGWREDDVLALSPARRQVYLELAGS